MSAPCGDTFSVGSEASASAHRKKLPPSFSIEQLVIEKKARKARKLQDEIDLIKRIVFEAEQVMTRFTDGSLLTLFLKQAVTTVG